MTMKNVWRTIILLLGSMACLAFGSDSFEVDSGYDPNAARKSAVGINPEIWRAALDVFNKAEVSAAIATETVDRQAAIATVSAEIAAHIASSGADVHGLGNYSTTVDTVASLTLLEDFVTQSIATAVSSIPGAATSGDEVLIETATTTYYLPFDGSTAVFSISSGSVSIAEYWVTAQASSTASALTVRLFATYDGFNGTLNLIESSAEIIQDRNADAWTIYTDADGHVVASVPSTVRAQVLKTEITTMEGD
jgi:hypothetical protein